MTTALAKHQQLTQRRQTLWEITNNLESQVANLATDLSSVVKGNAIHFQKVGGKQPLSSTAKEARKRVAQLKQEAKNLKAKLQAKKKDLQNMKKR